MHIVLKKSYVELLVKLQLYFYFIFILSKLNLDFFFNRDTLNWTKW